MARKGKEFELAYKWLYDLDKEKYKVTSPASLYDPFAEGQREIDVLVEFIDNDNISRKMAIECRDRNKIQDVMWIEQLQQKKVDLGLDYILATTTSNFSKGAINKARNHGVIIERAEAFNLESIKDVTSDKFFCDVFFFKMAFEELSFFVKDKGLIKYKDFIKQLNFAEQMELKNELNKGFYFSIDPHDILKHTNIKDEVFFQNDKDNSIILNKDICYPKEVSDIIKNKDIIALVRVIKITPFRLSLPLNKSLSVFNIDDNSNKKYCAIFGNEEDYIEIGYIENKGYSNIKLKPRKYLRLAGGKIHMNTIFPEMKEKISINWDEIMENSLGEFDFSKVI